MSDEKPNFPPDETTPALNCLVCDRPLDNLFPNEGYWNQPNGGLSFISQGQYGSTAFDPMDGTFLEINVCDACIKTKASEHQVIHGMRTEKARLWDG